MSADSGKCRQDVGLWPVDASRYRWSARLSGFVCPVVMVTPLDAGDGQQAGDIGQRGRRPWSVSLPPTVSCCGEGAQMAGVLHLIQVGKNACKTGNRAFTSPF